MPLALQLRFQAELNQMESIQEAERQLHQINQIRDVVTARNETAIYAQVRHFEIMVMFLIFLSFLLNDTFRLWYHGTVPTLWKKHQKVEPLSELREKPVVNLKIA